MSDAVPPFESLAHPAGFDRAFSEALKAEIDRVGLEAPTLDLAFVVFLRLLSSFGVFAFGPLSIDVEPLEEALERSGAREADDGGFEHLFEVLAREIRRSGSRHPNELHYLLAFMRVGEGLPARVFGELGVSPEQVEEFARRRALGTPSVADDAATAPSARLYSPEEAAAYLGVKVETVRAWIRSGRLRASRLAGQRVLRIRASDLEAVLEPVRPTAIREEARD